YARLVKAGERWKTVAEGTVVGYKRIVNIQGLRTDALRLVIDDARVRPTVAFLGVYAEAE
ncbi:MAG: alpha-fucosidase, partial [Clostridia bacterium]|nr:alpha-fucosidase [Clostridia bacterium]